MTHRQQNPLVSPLRFTAIIIILSCAVISSTLIFLPCWRCTDGDQRESLVSLVSDLCMSRYKACQGLTAPSASGHSHWASKGDHRIYSNAMESPAVGEALPCRSSLPSAVMFLFLPLTHFFWLPLDIFSLCLPWKDQHSRRNLQ